MTREQREILNRAVGILEGVSASSDLSAGMADTILNAAEMIDIALREDGNLYANANK